MQDAIANSRVARRVDAPRSSWFAALAAIGAFWLVQSVLIGIASVLLVIGVFHRESGPPRFEPKLLPAAFVGAFVGVRLGGWRGFLGLLAFASIGFIRALTSIGAAIDCSHGNIDACRGATDFDFVLPQAAPPRPLPLARPRGTCHTAERRSRSSGSFTAVFALHRGHRHGAPP